MKNTLVTNGKDTMRVSVGRRAKTATVTTYFDDGMVATKHRIILTHEEVEYYDGGTATWKDWITLLNSGWSKRIL